MYMTISQKRGSKLPQVKAQASLRTPKAALECGRVLRPAFFSPGDSELENDSASEGMHYNTGDYEKWMSGVQGIKARGGAAIAVTLPVLSPIHHWPSSVCQ